MGSFRESARNFKREGNKAMALSWKEKRELRKIKKHPLFVQSFKPIAHSGKMLGLNDEEIYMVWQTCSGSKKHPACSIRNDFSSDTTDKCTGRFVTEDRIKYLLFFLETDSSTEYSSNDFPYIPEIMMQENTVCASVFEDLKAEIADVNEFIRTVPILCAFAGIGAAAKWNEDWPALKATGIIPALTTAGGYPEMAAYVMDYIGIGRGSEENRTLNSRLREFCAYILDTSVCENYVNLARYFEGLAAMFDYGMVYGMKSVGINHTTSWIDPVSESDWD